MCTTVILRDSRHQASIVFDQIVIFEPEDTIYLYTSNRKTFAVVLKTEKWGSPLVSYCGKINDL